MSFLKRIFQYFQRALQEIDSDRGWAFKFLQWISRLPSKVIVRIRR